MMNPINNDSDFRQALMDLNAGDQRAIAAKFVEHVLGLSNDERLKRVVKTAGDTSASEDELSSALKSARAATFDSHTRCGSEGSWSDQAGYFVARAAVAAVTPSLQSRAEGLALQAAMSSRMARTSMFIDDEAGELTTQAENEWQYQLLSDYLNLKAQRK